MPHAQLNGIELGWSERGTGEAIVFLHGFPFDRGMWAEQLQRLPPGWRGIAPDLRGFGASRDPGDAPLTMTQHADDVRVLLGHIGIARAVVCGLSMGGYVAFELVRRHGALVRALVLCDTRAGADDEAGRAKRRQTAQQARTEGTGQLLQEMLPKLLAPATLEAQPDVATALERMMEAVPAETIARGSLGMAERHDATTLLPEIAVPVLVVGGEHDAITPPATLRELASSIPGAELRLLAGAGHVPPLEQPAAFADVLHRFLAGLPA